MGCTGRYLNIFCYWFLLPVFLMLSWALERSHAKNNANSNLVAPYSQSSWRVARDSIVLNSYDHIVKLPSVLSPLSPTANGAEWGDVYFGLAAVNHLSDSDKDVNGVFLLGFGIGDAKRLLGLDVSLGVTSVNPDDGGFGRDRHVNVKLHRELPHQFKIAIGAENLMANGFDRDFDKSYYLVLTKDFNLSNHQLSVSVGAGNGRFRTKSNIEDDKNTPGVFADVNYNVTRWLNVFADWTGNAVSLGGSVQPFKTVPITFTLAALDVTKNVVNTIPVAASIGFSYRF